MNVVNWELKNNRKIKVKIIKWNCIINSIVATKKNEENIPNEPEITREFNSLKHKSKEYTTNLNAKRITGQSILTQYYPISINNNNNNNNNLVCAQDEYTSEGTYEISLVENYKDTNVHDENSDITQVKLFLLIISKFNKAK